MEYILGSVPAFSAGNNRYRLNHTRNKSNNHVARFLAGEASKKTPLNRAEERGEQWSRRRLSFSHFSRLENTLLSRHLARGSSLGGEGRWWSDYLNERDQLCLRRRLPGIRIDPGASSTAVGLIPGANRSRTPAGNSLANLPSVVRVISRPGGCAICRSSFHRRTVGWEVEEEEESGAAARGETTDRR